MEKTNYGRAIRRLCTLCDVGTFGSLSDAQLMDRFLGHERNMAEMAFAALVSRHGPMVLRVCRIILRNEQDALDAFQASFLILLQKARTLQVRDSLGPWLHQVALRVAQYSRSTALRRRKFERTAAEQRFGKTIEVYEPEDLTLIIHLEIDRLPERFRRPVVLCCLEGFSREQAALHLGWPLGTVQSRLARGRKRLQAGLSRRGVRAPATIRSEPSSSGMTAGAAVSNELRDRLTRAVTEMAAGNTSATELISAGALSLTKGVLKTMLLSHVKLAATAVIAIGVAVSGAGVWASQRTEATEKQSPHTNGKAEFHAGSIPGIVARVNGIPITREQLAERCLNKYGQKELESVIALVVLDEACKRRGISVSNSEIEADATRRAETLGLSVSDWYRTLMQQRGMSKDDYLRDVVAPNLKLSKLGVNPDSLSGSSDVHKMIAKLEGRADIEILWGPRVLLRDEPASKPPSRSQEDRLRDVEHVLGQVLRTLKELKRPAGAITH
jgi:RNA polymerase sigma factor (sigma-70 family)